MKIEAKLLQVNPIQPEKDVIRRAAEVIRLGGLVAFPTETVYGLGADALNPEAVARIFTAKERPPNDPIIVHIADVEDLALLAKDPPEIARRLAEAFWPGPLTLVLPRAESVPLIVTAGLETVAVRMPSHPVALALIKASGTPIAAPSANLFGRPSPTTARHVLEDLGERVDLILDGGTTYIGVESTVLDLSAEKPTILRPGGTSREALCAILGEVEVARKIPREGEKLKSPGLMRRHYAPQATLLLFLGPEEAVLASMREKVSHLLREEKNVGLMLAQEDMVAFKGQPVFIQNLGPKGDLSQIAHRLFAAMRALDQKGVDVILARGFGSVGLGLAIEDRLLKAAGGRVIRL
jgi:L-threonylcarbamoyladenylate synthase